MAQCCRPRRGAPISTTTMYFAVLLIGLALLCARSYISSTNIVQRTVFMSCLTSSSTIVADEDTEDTAFEGQRTAYRVDSEVILGVTDRLRIRVSDPSASVTTYRSYRNAADTLLSPPEWLLCVVDTANMYAVGVNGHLPTENNVAFGFMWTFYTVAGMMYGYWIYFCTKMWCIGCRRVCRQYLTLTDEERLKKEKRMRLKRNKESMKELRRRFRQAFTCAIHEELQSHSQRLATYTLIHGEDSYAMDSSTFLSDEGTQEWWLTPK